MHTRNVNVKTATEESSRKMGEGRIESIEQAQAEALVINDEINRLVLERDWVSQCDYDYRHELSRLAEIKAFPLMATRDVVYDFHFLHWMRWTAFSLWERGYLLSR